MAQSLTSRDSGQGGGPDIGLMALPQDVMDIITSKLPIVDQASLMAVSREAKQVAQSALAERKCVLEQHTPKRRLATFIKFLGLHCQQLEAVELKLAGTSLLPWTADDPTWPRMSWRASVFSPMLSNCTRLTRLAILDLQQGLDNQALSSIAACCPKLLHLAIGNTVALTYNRRVTDSGITALSRSCSQLQGLQLLRLSAITDTSLASLGWLSSTLSSLALNDCLMVSDVGLVACLEQCTGLKELQASAAAGVDSGCLGRSLFTFHSMFNIASSCTQLTSLMLSEALIPAQGLEPSNLLPLALSSPALSSISLSHVDLSDELLLLMTTCNPGLKSLRLISTQVGDDGLIGAALLLNNLTELCIGGSDGRGRARGLRSRSHGPGGVSDASIYAVGSSCPKLQHLLVSGQSMVGNAGLVALRRSQMLPGLTRLGLNHLVGLRADEASAQQLSHVLACCTALVELQLDSCPCPLAPVLRTAALHCKDLRALSVRGAVGLEDNALIAVARNCARLQHVVLAWAWGLSPSGLDSALQLLAPRLTFLDIVGLSCVTDRTLQCIQANCRELTQLHVGGYPLADGDLLGEMSEPEVCPLWLRHSSGCSLGSSLDDGEAASSSMTGLPVEAWRTESGGVSSIASAASSSGAAHLESSADGEAEEEEEEAEGVRVEGEAEGELGGSQVEGEGVLYSCWMESSGSGELAPVAWTDRRAVSVGEAEPGMVVPVPLRSPSSPHDEYVEPADTPSAPFPSWPPADVTRRVAQAAVQAQQEAESRAAEKAPAVAAAELGKQAGNSADAPPLAARRSTSSAGAGVSSKAIGALLAGTWNRPGLRVSMCESRWDEEETWVLDAYPSLLG